MVNFQCKNGYKGHQQICNGKINVISSTVYAPSLMLFSQSAQNHHIYVLCHSTNA